MYIYIYIYICYYFLHITIHIYIYIYIYICPWFNYTPKRNKFVMGSGNEQAVRTVVNGVEGHSHGTMRVRDSVCDHDVSTGIPDLISLLAIPPPAENVQ